MPQQGFQIKKRPAFSPLSQAAPPSLDMRLCTSVPETAVKTPSAELMASSPCKSRASQVPEAGSRGIISATPCNTPTTGLVSTVSGNRLADASARTPLAAALNGALQAPSPPAHDIFALGFDGAQTLSPCRPRTLYPSGVGLVPTLPEMPTLSVPATSNVGAGVSPASSSIGPGMGDAVAWMMRSCGSTTEAELRAAVPEAYED